MSNEILRLKGVTVRFCNLYTPVAPNIAGSETSKRRYDIVLMIKNGSESDRMIRDAIETVAAAHCAGDRRKSAQWIKVLRSQDRIQYRDGAIKAVQYPEYENMHLLTATRAESQGAPVVRHRDGRTPLTESSGIPYPGSIVDAIVEIYVLKGSSKGGERISCSLTAVQFVRDGEAFGGQSYRPTDADFTSYEEPTEDNLDEDLPY